MAFSQSIQKGQIPVTCNLCEIDTKIQWKCINCDFLMCDKCKTKIHSKFKFAKDHKIIDIKEVGLYSEEVDFSHIGCTDHSGQTCCMFCKSCDKLVCPLCIAKIHNGHGLVEISEGYEIQVDVLKQGQSQVKTNIDELNKGETKLTEIKNVERNKYLEAKKEIQEHNKALIKSVNDNTEKLIKDLDQKWDMIKLSIEKEENKILPVKKSLTEQDTLAKDLLNLKNAEKVFKECKILETSFKTAIQQPKLLFNTMPKFLPGQLMQNNIGSLQEVSSETEVKVLKEFTTAVSRVGYVSEFKDDFLYVSNGEVLQKVKPEGTSLNTVSSFNINIYGMAATPDNDLLFVPGGTRLMSFNLSTGKTASSIYSVDPLILTAVYISKDYKIIVGAKTAGKSFPATGRRVVIVLNKEGKHEATYENDKNNQSIFTYARGMTKNQSGNICVWDWLSETNTGRIVILEKDGGVLNIYNGNPTINSEAKPFKPSSVISTLSDNIIVPDLDIHILHILNNTGVLITYINIKNIGIMYPCSLVFTPAGKAYIGCSRARTSTDNAKLYEVDIVGC